MATMDAWLAQVNPGGAPSYHDDMGDSPPPRPRGGDRYRSGGRDEMHGTRSKATGIMIGVVVVIVLVVGVMAMKQGGSTGADGQSVTQQARAPQAISADGAAAEGGPGVVGPPGQPGSAERTGQAATGTGQAGGVGDASQSTPGVSQRAGSADASGQSGPSLADLQTAQTVEGAADVGLSLTNGGLMQEAGGTGMSGVAKNGAGGGVQGGAKPGNGMSTAEIWNGTDTTVPTYMQTSAKAAVAEFLLRKDKSVVILWSGVGVRRPHEPASKAYEVISVQAKWMQSDTLRMGRFSVPVSPQGVALATPWVESYNPPSLTTATVVPSQQLFEAQALQAAVKAGWRDVTVRASVKHPEMSDIIVARIQGIPPGQGDVPTATTVWIEGSDDGWNIAGLAIDRAPTKES